MFKIDIKPKKIIKDVLITWLIIALLFIPVFLLYLGIDRIFFEWSYTKSYIETENMHVIGFANLVVLEFVLNIGTFIGIYRSGKSVQNNKVMHMSCVCGILWLFTLSDAFFINPEYIRYAYNLLIYIICIVISYYIYKDREVIEENTSIKK